MVVAISSKELTNGDLDKRCNYVSYNSSKLLIVLTLGKSNL